MNINPKFVSLLNNPDIRFTIILGSGFHRQAIGGNSILSNWSKLLNQYGSDKELTGFYLLDFEQLIVQSTLLEEHEKSLSKAASEVEKKISDEICFDLSCAQEKVLKFSRKKYPKGIFNPRIVSDVISLNFDTTAEVICCELANVKKPILKSSKIGSTKGTQMDVPYIEIPFVDNEIIRFWHPHGSINDKSNITLGIREYSKRMQLVESLRKYSKSEEHKHQISWYRQLTHNPVIILGAEMSINEWDLWFAIINRERNFAKKENQQYKYPIFQMRECECKNNAQHQWFEPLFLGLSYDQQWEELKKIFEKNQKLTK